MTNNSPKCIAHKTLIKNRLYSLNNYTYLQHIIESNQFTIIEYKKHANSKPVSELINRLGIENEIKQNDSFLYIKNNLKFVFLYADISDEDKCSLLRHELGHICDPDLKINEMCYSKIKKEEFANDFSFYTKNPGFYFKLKLFVTKKWKIIVSMIALIACVLVLLAMINPLITEPSKPRASDVLTNEIIDNTYYVTPTGKKYHRKHCFIVKYKNNLTKKTLKEALDTGYKPCLICNPDK